MGFRWASVGSDIFLFDFLVVVALPFAEYAVSSSSVFPVAGRGLLLGVCNGAVLSRSPSPPPNGERSLLSLKVNELSALEAAAALMVKEDWRVCVCSSERRGVDDSGVGRA